NRAAARARRARIGHRDQARRGARRRFAADRGRRPRHRRRIAHRRRPGSVAARRRRGGRRDRPRIAARPAARLHVAERKPFAGLGRHVDGTGARRRAIRRAAANRAAGARGRALSMGRRHRRPSGRERGPVRARMGGKGARCAPRRHGRISDRGGPPAPDPQRSGRAFRRNRAAARRRRSSRSAHRASVGAGTAPHGARRRRDALMLRRLRLPLRLLSIQRTLLRYGLDEIVWNTHLFRPLAWVQKLLPGATIKTRPLGERLRLALEELGPIYVKFGQAVSTRRDLLSPALANELAKLQDQVPPFSSDVAVAGPERALNRPESAVFAKFEREPLAAASIAQVHAARLVDGTEVVVKILRPDVRVLIERDIEVLYQLARLAERYWPDARRLRPVEVVREFQKTLLHEVDLQREAANAAQLKRNFADSGKLYVPQVYWDYCRTNVLTMERIRGIPISNIAALKAGGANIRLLAENGVEIFFTQVFRHNFFHADMHPGNIFVDLTDPAKPRYIAVDFGIVGSLSDEDQHYLAENFLAFFRRDYRRVAELHVDSGWVPPETRVDELESAVRAVCEPIFDRPLKDISFGLVLLRLFETAREFHME